VGWDCRLTPEDTGYLNVEWIREWDKDGQGAGELVPLSDFAAGDASIGHLHHQLVCHSGKDECYVLGSVATARPGARQSRPHPAGFERIRAEGRLIERWDEIPGEWLLFPWLAGCARQDSNLRPAD
jgi:hypothetical protein